MSDRRCWFVCSVFLFLMASPAMAQPTAETFFEQHVRPLLSSRCWDCHAEDVAESGLRMDSRQALLVGGERGPALKPGDAQGSLLILAVEHGEADLQMPEGDKLSSEEIGMLKKWIDDGAIWPNSPDYVVATSKDTATGSLFTDEQKSFWAFQPLALPPLPTVQNAQWARNEIDYFVLARLEANRLSPAAPADKRTLVRRAYFDLIGLPPSPQQIAEFLNDNSPDAWETLIDNLLSSPAYGERWGRHWLDVARYADSNGLDENIAFEFIYKYRDWVIRAFNADMPFNQFVVEQLAGDLIPQSEGEAIEAYVDRVIATGFLSVGPKMVADDDPIKKALDVVDEQLNTTSQAFMGLTIGCARCHDHKFDPIPQWDYYAMAGIFRSTKTLEHLGVVAPIAEHSFQLTGYQSQLAEWEAQRHLVQSELDEFLSEMNVPEDEKKQSEFLQHLAGAAQERYQAIKSRLEEVDAQKPPEFIVMAVKEQEPVDLPVMLRGNYLTPGEPTRRQFLRIFTGEQPTPLETDQSGRLQLARWIADDTHPLTPRVIVNRIWRWRFGRGIVGTPDNFGLLGERPTHPQLLNWLAHAFVHQDAWSMKAMHKRMMMSATYQMQSAANSQAMEVDPENRLWWRFPQRRMEAEVIRDNTLAVSGQLDRTMYGSLMTQKDKQYITGTASSVSQYDNTRRSVYQPIYRSAVYDLLTAFDFPDPATLNGDRKESIVAPQALLMMNSKLIDQASQKLARRILTEEASTAERIDLLYEILFARIPHDFEQQQVEAFLPEFASADSTDAKVDQQVAAWQSVCRALMSTHEFICID
ncbi:MAG: PSD1 domain-containing protein [Planctomycetales bacterium]|nr:PSD1 domain-containing protein [Planctomycetales bacterium]